MSANGRGILAMLLAMVSFSLMDAALKALAGHYPVMQVAALRALVSLPLVLGYLWWRRAFPGLWEVRWPLHALRALLGVAMLSLFSFALRSLPLSEAYALFFIAPLLIAALSAPLLGETVSRENWWAILVGFAGVLIVLRPSGSGLVSLAGWAVLGAAACYAISAISVRYLARTDSGESMVFWQLFGVALIAGAWAAPDWLALRGDDAGWLALLGLSGFIGQLAITEAFRIAPPALVTPYEYSALAWGLALDALIWQTLPDAIVLVGALVIVASGVYLARHVAKNG
jgi:drug/metabolite transporter (DMT)-like permease